MIVGDCQVGGIYFFYSQAIQPPGDKLHVCINQGQFFVINTKNIWPASLLIKQADYPTMLNYDSYLGCGTIMYEHLDKDIGSGAPRGGHQFLLEKTAREIIKEMQYVESLYEAEIQMVTANMQDFIKRHYPPPSAVQTKS